MTTHSPIVLRELASHQLFIVRAISSMIPQIQIEGAAPAEPQKLISNYVYALGNSLEAQKTLRSCAEAFLAPSVIVCEGKTEIGLIRGMDLFVQNNNRRSIVAHGVHWTDGGGSSMYERAITLAKLGYRTALFMDSDDLPPVQTFTDLENAGVTVFRWPDGQATENAIFNSVPPRLIPDLLNVACSWKSRESVDGKIKYASGERYDLAYCLENFAEDMRGILGACAGEKRWYKDIDPAERIMRDVIAPSWVQVGDGLKGTINAIWTWANNSSTVQPEKLAPIVAN